MPILKGEALQALEEKNLLTLYDSFPSIFDKHISEHGYALSEELILGVHYIATKGVIDWTPGRYRRERVEVVNRENEVVFKPVDYLEIVPRMEKFIPYFNSRSDASPTSQAALLLWYINWLHPFCNGNGRTARSLCYLVMCLGHRKILPGSFSVPEQLALKRSEHIELFQPADKNPNIEEVELSGLELMLAEMLVKQLES